MTPVAHTNSPISLSLQLAARRAGHDLHADRPDRLAGGGLLLEVSKPEARTERPALPADGYRIISGHEKRVITAASPHALAYALLDIAEGNVKLDVSGDQSDLLAPPADLQYFLPPPGTIRRGIIHKKGYPPGTFLNIEPGTGFYFFPVSNRMGKDWKQ